ARHAVRREPLVGEPVMRSEEEPACVELRVDVRDAVLEIGPLDREAEVAHPHVEQLLIGQRRPVGRYAIVGWRVDHSVSRSYASAMRSSIGSSKRRPVSCSPIGNPPSPADVGCGFGAVKPHGTLIAGRPARFALTVKTSARYICTGSAVRSPMRNAGTGLVGIATASTADAPPKASS